MRAGSCAQAVNLGIAEHPLLAGAEPGVLNPGCRRHGHVAREGAGQVRSTGDRTAARLAAGSFPCTAWDAIRGCRGGASTVRRVVVQGGQAGWPSGVIAGPASMAAAALSSPACVTCQVTGRRAGWLAGSG